MWAIFRVNREPFGKALRSALLVQMFALGLGKQQNELKPNKPNKMVTFFRI